MIDIAAILKKSSARKLALRDAGAKIEAMREELRDLRSLLVLAAENIEEHIREREKLPMTFLGYSRALAKQLMDAGRKRV